MQTSFYIKPAKNERIETTVHLTADSRPCLTGTVTDGKNKPIGGALVTVYTTGEDSSSPIGSVYTDDTGIFTFGPLEPAILYQVRIYKNDENQRELEP